MSDETSMDLSSGIAAFESKHFANAANLLAPLADAGNAEAQYRMAIMCQNGLGRAQNDVDALKWMQLAADQGQPYAQHGLGFMYMQGECIEKDEAEAVKWLTLAAEQKLPGSAMTLGMMYEQGQGVEKTKLKQNAGTNWPKIPANEASPTRTT